MIKARNFYLLVLAVALAAVIISANSSYAQNEKFRAKLTGDNTTSKAVINFKTKPDMMTYKMIGTGISGATDAKIKLGKVGEGNDVVVDLLKVSKAKDTVNGTIIRGNITDESLTGSMSGKTLADLRTAMANNDTYISVGGMSGLIKAKASNATSNATSGSSLGASSTDQSTSSSITPQSTESSTTDQGSSLGASSTDQGSSSSSDDNNDKNNDDNNDDNNDKNNKD